MAYYFLEGKLVAAAAMGKIPDIVFLNEALKLNIPMRASDIKSGRLNMKDIQEKVKLLGKEC